tara:strand:- start:1748 stop:2209 length:462 start_codon:yes stop_codon:yes gene_type:complete
MTDTTNVLDLLKREISREEKGEQNFLVDEEKTLFASYEDSLKASKFLIKNDGTDDLNMFEIKVRHLIGISVIFHIRNINELPDMLNYLYYVIDSLIVDIDKYASIELINDDNKAVLIDYKYQNPLGPGMEEQLEKFPRSWTQKCTLRFTKKTS